MSEKQKKNFTSTLISTAIFIAIGIAVYYFIRNDKKQKEYDYYAYFHDVKGLARSSEVQINGVRVGKITDVQLTTERMLKVVITTKEGVQLPQGTVASLASGGMTGDKIVKLLPGKGPSLPDKATLITNLDSSVLPLEVRITPMLKTAKFMLRGTDSALRTFNVFLRSGLISSTVADLIYLEKETRSYAKLSDRYNTKSDEIVADINAANKSVTEVANDFNNVGAKLKNAEQSLSNTANKDLVGNVKSLQSSFASLGKTFSKLNSSSAANDRKTYTNTSSSLDTLNSNMQETYKDPPGFTIFGSSKKK